MYDWDKKDGWPEHVGIVEKVSGKTITVIEGNKSDAVGRRTISVGDASIRGYGRPKYTAENTNTGKEPSANKIKVDGKWGKDTTTLAQIVFGTEVDGIVSNQYKAYKSQNTGLLSESFEWEDNPIGYSPLILAIQKWCGAKQDGYVGPDFATHLQKKLGTPADGKLDNGGACIRAFQTWLNSQV